jgi:hypothetical protein
MWRRAVKRKTFMKPNKTHPKSGPILDADAGPFLGAD